MGLQAFGKVQCGKEGTAGTPVAATAIRMGEYSFEWGEALNVDQPDFLDGNISRAAEAVILGRMANVMLKGTLTFEDFIYPLAGGIKTGVTGGAGDGGSPVMYTWAYFPTLTGTMDTPQAFTLECGDDTIAERAEYGVCQNFSISGGVNQHTEITENWIGRQFTVNAFTGALSNRAVNIVAAQKWVLSMDATGGTIGTTAYTGCLKSFTFNSGPLFAPYHCIDGNLFYQSVKRQTLAPELRLVVAVDTTAIAGLRTAWRAGTRQLIRLRNTGPIIHDAVTNRIDLEMAGHITNMANIGGAVDEGVYTEELTIQGAYDSTWGKLMNFAIQNKVATIP